MKKLLLTLFLFGSFSAVSADLLNIYVAPPKQRLDWSSAGSLYRSLLRARLFLSERPFGSAGADLVCGKETRSISADAESFDVIGPVVIEGRGLGHLFSGHPGKLLTGQNAVTKNKEVINSPGARFISFIISEGQCERIKSFWKEIEKYNIAKNFGLPHRPLMGEGLTDTSLIVSTLAAADFLVPDQKERWDRSLYLPRKLSGAPLSDEYVSVFRLVSGDWGSHSDDSIILHFWDPELIVNWIDLQIATKRTIRKLSDVTKGIPGIEFDLSKRPVPQGTFWEQANDPTYKK